MLFKIQFFNFSGNLPVQNKKISSIKIIITFTKMTGLTRANVLRILLKVNVFNFFINFLFIIVYFKYIVPFEYRVKFSLNFQNCFRIRFFFITYFKIDTITHLLSPDSMLILFKLFNTLCNILSPSPLHHLIILF